jgi:heat shock protein HslJ
MRPILLSLVLVVALAACGGDDDDTVDAGTGEPAPAEAPRGDYLSTSVEGHDLVDGTDLALTLDEEELSGMAGCNGFGGPYHLEDFDGTTGVVVIDSDGMSMTEMACDPPRMDQDTWMTGLLMARPTLTVIDADTFTLSDGTATITFVDREIADPDRPLTGTKWTVDTILTGDAASSMPAGGTVVTFEFGDDSRALVTGADCTSVDVPYEVADDTITFGEYGVDDIGCPAPWQETRELLDAGTVNFSIDHDRLSLTAPDGNGLGFLGV